MHSFILTFIAFFFCSVSFSQVLKVKKQALVFGNNEYILSPLKNPINDANGIAESLNKMGFQVKLLVNANLKTMNNEIDNWVAKLEYGDIALFYFAGHGAEIDSQNFLFPTDAKSSNKRELEFETYSLNRIIDKLKTVKTSTNIIILDACRNNPFTQNWEKSHRGFGLAAVLPPPNTFIGFAAAPGATASDGDQKNGIYTEAILKYISSPDLSIDQVFNRVSKEVNTLTNGKQTPFKSSSLDEDFYFTNSSANKTAPFNNLTTEPKKIIQYLNVPYAEMVYVKGGQFLMGDNEGDDNEKPLHKVTLAPFYIGKYEVTVAQFAKFVSETAYFTEKEKTNKNQRLPEPGDYYLRNIADSIYTWRYSVSGQLVDLSSNHPVINVSWNDAMAFCNWLSTTSSLKFRLPTEAEWEYAANEGNKQNKTLKDRTLKSLLASKIKVNTIDYALHKELSPNNQLVYNDSFKFTAPVGSFSPNTLGIYDIFGNVWEWCMDVFDEEFYMKSPLSNPLNLDISGYGEHRVLRGGAWSSPDFYERFHTHPHNTGSPHKGFRIVCEIQN